MEFSTTEAYVHDMTHVVPQVTKTVPGTTVPCLLSRRGQSQSHRPEVHVTTEHITMAEYPWVPVRPLIHQPTDSLLEHQITTLQLLKAASV